MRKPLALLAALAAAAALAVPALAGTRTVVVGDDYFVRDGTKPTVTVTRNTTVRWTWRGDGAHNVVVTKGPVKFRSPVRRAPYRYSKKMTRRGTYTLVCTIHREDMRMTLRVR